MAPAAEFPRPLTVEGPSDDRSASWPNAPAFVAAATDVGLKRSGNEDSFAVWHDDDTRPWSERRLLMVVADGMGGSVAGELASRLTVETVVRRMSESAVQSVEVMRGAVEEANRTIRARSRAEPNLEGMGTTCTAIVLRDRRATIAHVGDSRAYLIRDGRIRRLTQDHSLVAHLIQRNELTEEQARHDARRHVLIRSVGVADRIEVDAFEVKTPLRMGDTLLVCSDGLHGVISDSDLAAIAEEADGLGVMCRQMIATANDAGGPDNITVVAARIRPPGMPPGASRSWREIQVGRTITRAALVVLFGMIVFSVLVGLARLGATP